MTEQERLRKGDYCVQSVTWITARALVWRWHYARGTGTGLVYRHGLFRKGETLCRGVALWATPALGAAQSAWEGPSTAVLALSRLVIAQGEPTNAASFLLAASIKRIRADGRYRCLLTYADEGQGHTGAIYRATNWEYRGRTRPKPRWRDPKTGHLVADKDGHGYHSVQEMQQRGYVLEGRSCMHKFRLILPPARAPRTLFDRLRASDA